jgi:hypothetical protein
MDPLSELQDVGAQLVEHARQDAGFSARGVLGELFPYVQDASQRMSTRAISRWLADTHGIKLSAVSISKALRNPDKYWDEYFDAIEPAAINVENQSEVFMKDFLLQGDLFFNVVEPKCLDLISAGWATNGEVCDADQLNADLQKLNSLWFNLDESIRARGSGTVIKRCAQDDTESGEE